MNIQQMKAEALQRLGKRKLLTQQKTDAEALLIKNRELIEKIAMARALVQAVAKNTQKNIEFHLSNLVTMALASVFPDPYEFKVEFVERRNTTEADLVFTKNGHPTDNILSSGGGGVADIADFALKVALWSIKKQKSRATFILDEPDKFLHDPLYQERASDMMKTLCDRSGVQIIMVSDQQGVRAKADKVIEIENVDGASFVKEG